MLLKNEVLERVISGEVSLIFRRWKRPTVKTGGSLKTRKGILAIESVDEVELSELTKTEIGRGGFKSIEELSDSLSDRDGPVYRIKVKFAGEDPRIALRRNTRISKKELDEIRQTLGRWDQSKVFGAWTLKYLSMIDKQPNTHAQILADSVGLAKNRFKGNVRKLKELGLTESLRPGYKLSPRGKKVLTALSKTS
jgi:hypothetical protein